MSKLYTLTIVNQEWSAFERLFPLLQGELVSVSYADPPEVSFTVTYMSETPLSQPVLAEITEQLYSGR